MPQLIRHRKTVPPAAHWRSERGAILIHVAVGMIAILAISALTVDYGVMWVSRGQAQNAADSAAHAAAISLAFVDPDDQDLARNSALSVAQQHQIWDGQPDVTAGDITFPACPPGAPGPPDTCVRADVFRNQRAGGSPLPTFFAQFVGLTEQGVRATATAQVLYGDTADCVKPWAVSDKWLELNPEASEWDPDDMFERYEPNGPDAGALLDPADFYEPPSNGSTGTGFTLADDYGTELILKAGNPQQAIGPGWFFPVIINPSEGPGGDNYRENIATCDPTPVGPGSVLTNEPGNMIGPTRQGVLDLIAQDPDAFWDPSANGGQGAPSGGCMADGTCGLSARLVAIPLFNPDAYDAGRASGRIDIDIVNVMGFWLEGMQGNDVVGYITHYPALASGSSTVSEESAFLRTVVLVR